ncbi:hypothetical protein AN280_22145 [Pseudomonas aeruginosa]|nr:hypothetical protein ATC05_24045 [Pseudomonas aeruginosa]KQJ53200.1 hypothetical protein AN280_22145 [Pseudomonas aeruginosa]KXE41433.1 hypothetical protein AW924_09445 [Pseudomonas aeruginosa]KXE49305.1 hypothetical protein AW925_09580 [Pseudomonas aeruginosa]KXE51318.1 hypothetical protein AW926_09245 [Pseudomonas aeruginosa]
MVEPHRLPPAAATLDSGLDRLSEADNSSMSVDAGTAQFKESRHQALTSNIVEPYTLPETLRECGNDNVASFVVLALCKAFCNVLRSGRRWVEHQKSFKPHMRDVADIVSKPLRDALMGRQALFDIIKEVEIGFSGVDDCAVFAQAHFIDTSRIVLSVLCVRCSLLCSANAFAFSLLDLPFG